MSSASPSLSSSLENVHPLPSLLPVPPHHLLIHRLLVCADRLVAGTATCVHTGRVFEALVPIPRGVNAVALASGARFMVIPANDKVDITGLCTVRRYERFLLACLDVCVIAARRRLHIPRTPFFGPRLCSS
jgi:hypothetical protein